MSGPRAVRIPRGRPVRPAVAVRPAAPAGAAGARRGAAGSTRENGGGTQRATRFAILYVLALGGLDATLVGVDLGNGEGSHPAVVSGLFLFSLLAVALAAGAVVFALTPAPRRREASDAGVVVIGRWGTRREFPPRAELDLTVVHRYRAGFLSSEPVELVQVRDLSGRRRAYLVESGFFDA